MSSTAVTIGNFDGAHLGHAALVGRARGLVGPGGRVVVLAFDPHPASVLRPGAEPARLTTFAQRVGLLRGVGADEVLRLEPDRALLSMTPDRFMDEVVRAFAPAWLVEGADFHFGKGRAGHVAELREIGGRLGFGVEVVEGVEAVLSDHAVVKASSSIARWLLERGRVGDASAVLGRPHEVTGVVTSGDRRGRTIGFPTINIEAEQMTPGPGVYAGRATLPDGRVLGAAVHVGERPTVGDGRFRLEAHLLGLPTSVGGGGGWALVPGLEETGWRCSLRFEHWLRDPVRFDGVDQLAGQLARDCVRAGELLASPAVSRVGRMKEVHA
jgi:riboflavin kinase/FMN adenylyltransferase